MSSGGKEKMNIYDVIISSPGMFERCKIGVNLSRQNIFILCRIIESGLNGDKEAANGMLDLLSKESKEELLTVVPEFLKKSNLTDFYEKLKSL
jgi:hypothetical protein